MPELPEAERARQAIERALNREIVAVDDSDTYVCRPHAPGEIAAALTGGRLTAAHRRGKFMWVETDDGGPDLGLHLGMAGRIAIDEPPAGRWDRFVLQFADGGRLALHDRRRLGRAVIKPDFTHIGPDAGEGSREAFRARTGHGDTPAKARCLDHRPVAAVGHLELEVPPGVCFGLLGPNGAGKSTTMRLLTAQAIADEGDIRVLGNRLPSESKAARLVMGVVPQLDNLDVELTARENLAVFAWLYRVPRGERRDAVDRALGRARLMHRADTPVNELSGGMRRRLLIARGLVHTPRLVLLDEPTVGLDPQVRQELWSLIDGLRAEGVTVLMSTHYIEEAERLADTVAIMAEGSVVAEGRPSELVVAHAGREVVEVYGPPARLAEVQADAEAAGHATRRTGPAIAVLRAEDLDGRVPEGAQRRAAAPQG